MKPAVSTPMPVARSATHSMVARRNRRLRPGIASPVATVETNDSPSAVAMRSCPTGLTGIGTSPTPVRKSPADTIDPRNAREARRRMPRGSATAISTPYTARRKPEKMVMLLKVRPEKSVWVPSWEKWSCHHVASCVVRIATATPTGSDSTASRPMRWAMCAGSAFAASGAAGIVATVVVVTVVAVAAAAVVVVAEREGASLEVLVAAFGSARATAGSGSTRVRVGAVTATVARAGGTVTGGASERVVGGIRLTIGSARRARSRTSPQRTPGPGPVGQDGNSPVQRRTAYRNCIPQSRETAGRWYMATPWCRHRAGYAGRTGPRAAPRGRRAGAADPHLEEPDAQEQQARRRSRGEELRPPVQPEVPCGERRSRRSGRHAPAGRIVVGQAGEPQRRAPRTPHRIHGRLGTEAPLDRAGARRPG